MSNPLDTHPVVVTRRDGRYVLLVPDFRMVVEDAALESAYQRLESQLSAYADAAAASGLSDCLAASARAAAADDRMGRLMPFFVKAAIVTLVGAFLLAAASISFTYALREPLQKAVLKMGRGALASATKGIEEFAEKDLSGDRADRLRNGLRAAVPKLRPYFDELRPLFEPIEVSCRQ